MNKKQAQKNRPYKNMICFEYSYILFSVTISNERNTLKLENLKKIQRKNKDNE